MQGIETETAVTECAIPLGGELAPELIADDAWAAPGWREAALEYHKHRGNRASISPYAPEHLARLRRLMDDDSPERAWYELCGLRSGAAASTVEALMFALRSRGVQALGEPDVVHRLARLNDAQVREVAVETQTAHCACVGTGRRGSAYRGQE